MRIFFRWVSFILIGLTGMLSLITLSGCESNEGVLLGNKAPGFSGTDIAGEFMTLSQFKGKVVVLYFWSKSCCGDRLSAIEPFYRKNSHRGLAVVAINVGDSRETVQAYAKSHALNFSMQTDNYNIISVTYRVLGMPTVFLLDGEGIIREKVMGAVPAEKLEQLIQRQLDLAKVASVGHEKKSIQ